MDRHGSPGAHAQVAAHPGSLWEIEPPDGARLGEEAGLRILGVDPELDGGPGRTHVFLAHSERFPRRDPDLFPHEIEPGHHLGHGVLHL